jgi:hypothetical protein
MSLPIQRCVRKQHIKYLHNRIHFTPEYFHLMKKRNQNNIRYILKTLQQPEEKEFSRELINSPRSKHNSRMNFRLDDRRDRRYWTNYYSNHLDISVFCWLANEKSTSVSRTRAMAGNLCNDSIVQ